LQSGWLSKPIYAQTTTRRKPQATYDFSMGIPPGR